MKTRTAATYPLTSATLMLASFHLPFSDFESPLAGSSFKGVTTDPDQ
jgi:hypothetical protein